MFELLIKYHDPRLYSFLKNNDLTPELFATPWFLTVFCSKMEISLVYQLWDLFLLGNERSNLLFLGLAMVFKEKDKFFESEISVLPQILTTLVIRSETELNAIFDSAMQIKQNTPLSFLVFLHDRLRKKKDYAHSLLEIENMDTLTLNHLEIMHEFYQKDLKCKEKDCIFCSKDKENTRKDRILQKFPNFFTFYKEISSKKKPNFLIIDFRKERSSGFLKRSQIVHEGFSGKEVLKDLKELRGNYHMVLLGEKEEIYQEFLNENVEFVSKLNGFETIHDLHQTSDIDMLGHERTKCEFCGKTRKNKGFMAIFQNFFKKKNEKTINSKNLNEDYEKNEENSGDSMELIEAETNEDIGQKTKENEEKIIEKNQVLNGNGNNEIGNSFLKSYG